MFERAAGDRNGRILDVGFDLILVIGPFAVDRVDRSGTANRCCDTVANAARCGDRVDIRFNGCVVDCDNLNVIARCQRAVLNKGVGVAADVVQCFGTTTAEGKGAAAARTKTSRYRGCHGEGHNRGILQNLDVHPALIGVNRRILDGCFQCVGDVVSGDRNTDG